MNTALFLLGRQNLDFFRFADGSFSAAEGQLKHIFKEFLQLVKASFFYDIFYLGSEELREYENFLKLLIL